MIIYTHLEEGWIATPAHKWFTPDGRSSIDTRLSFENAEETLRKNATCISAAYNPFLQEAHMLLGFSAYRKDGLIVINSYEEGFSQRRGEWTRDHVVHVAGDDARIAAYSLCGRAGWQTQDCKEYKTIADMIAALQNRDVSYLRAKNV